MEELPSTDKLEATTTSNSLTMPKVTHKTTSTTTRITRSCTRAALTVPSPASPSGNRFQTQPRTSRFHPILTSQSTPHPRLRRRGLRRTTSSVSSGSVSRASSVSFFSCIVNTAVAEQPENDHDGTDVDHMDTISDNQDDNGSSSPDNNTSEPDVNHPAETVNPASQQTQGDVQPIASGSTPINNERNTVENTDHCPQPSAFVKKFLQTVHPNLEGLLPNFLMIGIDSEIHLNALLEWRAEDRKNWLNLRREALNMSKLQLWGLLIACNHHELFNN